ncbi:hypothetical protein K491DRAFT_720504 [Lophiostoma macrostomum CBS 122681]|uniref:BTB domain-containing protein n=1 Tax=Lophiostoma macrostomum CBS 122681 TaxID=1314788 RepID=A0A6A6SUI2_9PLEO|nr:hypothetical protein K491DRAFT_720504 [Lophiostoma macrostomum CBS 122681]
MAVLSTLRGVKLVHWEPPLLHVKCCPIHLGEIGMPDLVVNNTYEGVTKIYFCHSRVLCPSSTYFSNLFLNGSWREGQTGTADLKDDLPEVFAFWLKWEYTRVFDLEEIFGIIGQNQASVNDPANDVKDNPVHDPVDPSVDVLRFLVAAALHADKYNLTGFASVIIAECCRFAQEKESHQIQQAMDYFHERGGRPRLPFFKMLRSMRMLHLSYHNPSVRARLGA